RQIALEIDERIVGAAIDLYRWQSRDLHGFGSVRDARLRDGNLDSRMRLERAVERVRREEYVGRRQKRPRMVAAQQLVARLGVLPEVRNRIRDVADERNRGALREVVGERRS